MCCVLCDSALHILNYNSNHFIKKIKIVIKGPLIQYGSCSIGMGIVIANLDPIRLVTIPSSLPKNFIFCPYTTPIAIFKKIKNIYIE